MISNRAIKLPGVAIFSLLLLISLGVTYLMITKGILVGIVILGILLGGIYLAATLKDFRIAFYSVFLMGIFMFYVNRMLNLVFPLGTVYDGLVALAFFAVFLNERPFDWRGFWNPITMMFVILIVFQILQLFNPNATSSVAWLVSLRNNTSFLIYVVCFHMFSSLKEVRRFTSVWIGVAFLTGLYGIFQHFFGLSAREMEWMNQSPERIGLYIIWGELRVFSFLSDPSAYGLFIGITSLATMVLTLGPFRLPVKIGYGLLTIVLLVAMSYSGTRTAIALVIAGIAFYILIMLHNRRILIASAGMVLVGAVLLFGPFYGSTMSRLRSTFKASEDPSMAVRDYKRQMFQEYIKSNPIGGGLNTVGHSGARYSPGHPLAGEWDPDSGYLFTALESGWVGLIIVMGVFFIVMLTGINRFFSIRDPVLKVYTLAYIVPFFALSVAHFAQDAMFTKPMNVIVFATYALVYKIATLEKKLHSTEMI